MASIEEDVKRNLEIILDTNVGSLDIPEGIGEPEIQGAIRYVCFPVGSLWRPKLLWAVAQGYDVERKTAMFYGAGIETIHAASLAEDDTPTQDNALKRRNKLSCWKHFEDKYKQRLFDEGDDETKAKITKGNFDEEALKFGINITRSATEVLEKKLYNSIIDGPASNGQMPRILKEINDATGDMWPGQIADVHYTKELENLTDFTDMYRRKTGVLFGASAAIGAILGGRKGYGEVKGWRNFGVHLGVAFQLSDDLLELKGEQITGKSSEEYENKKRIFDVAEFDKIIEARETYAGMAKLLLRNTGVQKFDAVNKYFHGMERVFREKFNSVV
jgi:geranylgeranyl pyrophosphate synthase